jgi:hypothetical protein
MPIKQIKVTANNDFEVLNPQTRELLYTLVQLKDAEHLGVFGDVLQGNTNATAVGIVLTAYNCTSLDQTYKAYSANNTVTTLERLQTKNPQHMQLFMLLRDQQLLEYKNGAWEVAKVSKLVRERIVVNGVPITNFMNVVTGSATETNPAVLAPAAPDWVHVLLHKIAKLNDSSNLRVFGSAVTLHKQPADLDVAIVLDTDDWNDAQLQAADLMSDLLNIHENGFLGELLDLYVCLSDTAYKWLDDVGDWVQVHDGKQLSQDVLNRGLAVQLTVTSAITTKMPKRRRLKTDPEHRQDRKEYKQAMRNPGVRRALNIKRKKYVKKNKVKLTRKANIYRTWRAKQSF